MSELRPVDEIEELADFYVHRPLARVLGRLLLATPVTPDQVTILSGLVGVSAGGLLWLGADRPALRILAAVLLFGSVVLDCTDGFLARMRRQISRTGVILDGFTDAVVGFVVLLAATAVAARHHPGAAVWALGAAAMASTEAQCFLFDVAKERYVTGLGIPYAGSKLLLADHWSEIERARADTRPGDALLLAGFARYARIVRTLGGWAHVAPAVRPAARGQMRAWALIGLGTHMACLYVAAAVSAVWPPALYACLILFSTVMNALLLALLWSARLTGVA
jgi:CDP-alcohol phosphatidyltransferase-like enzyme